VPSPARANSVVQSRRPDAPESHELRQGLVHELCIVPDIAETFYAITLDRRFPHPLVRSLLARDEAELPGVVG